MDQRIKGGPNPWGGGGGHTREQEQHIWHILCDGSKFFRKKGRPPSELNWSSYNVLCVVFCFLSFLKRRLVGSWSLFYAHMVSSPFACFVQEFEKGCCFFYGVDSNNQFNTICWLARSTHAERQARAPPCGDRCWLLVAVAA